MGKFLKITDSKFLLGKLDGFGIQFIVIVLYYMGDICTLLLNAVGESQRFEKFSSAAEEPLDGFVAFYGFQDNFIVSIQHNP